MQSRFDKQRLIKYNFDLGVARAIVNWKKKHRTNNMPVKELNKIIKIFKLATKEAER